MILQKENAKTQTVENCHEGSGILHCTELLADYEKTTPGFKFIHDDIVEPGATIGSHTHEGDEEIYIIIEGNGIMEVDGEQVEVGPGDAVITRSGHSHALVNNSNKPMRILVVCTAV